MRGVSRKELEEAVKWVLENRGGIYVRRFGRLQRLGKVGNLPGGAVEFWSVSLTRAGFDRPPLPGELRRLGAFRSLQRLYLGGFTVAPEDWSYFSGLRQLEILHFKGIPLSAGAATWIARCKELKTLELVGCEGLTPEFLRTVASGASGVRQLSLSGSALGEEAGVELGRFERLESLILDGTGLSPGVFPAWAGIHSLRSLILPGGDWTREALEALSRHPIEKFGFLDTDNAALPAQLALVGELFPKLLGLELNGKALSANHAEVLVEKFKNLKVLNLGCVQPSLAAAKTLAKLPHLRVLACRAAEVEDTLFREFLAIRSLEELDVEGTQVSDHSVEAIQRAGSNGLRFLNATGTRISKQAVESLERRVKGLSVRIVPLEGIQ